MSANKTKGDYMLIFRGNDWHKGLSPEQMQQVASRWMDWFNGPMADGRVLAGQFRVGTNVGPDGGRSTCRKFQAGNLLSGDRPRKGGCGYG